VYFGLLSSKLMLLSKVNVVGVVDDNGIWKGVCYYLKVICGIHLRISCLSEREVSGVRFREEYIYHLRYRKKGYARWKA
jgi:hypothetical protein